MHWHDTSCQRSTYELHIMCWHYTFEWLQKKAWYDVAHQMKGSILCFDILRRNSCEGKKPLRWIMSMHSMEPLTLRFLTWSILTAQYLYWNNTFDHVRDPRVNSSRTSIAMHAVLLWIYKKECVAHMWAWLALLCWERRTETLHSCLLCFPSSQNHVFLPKGGFWAECSKSNSLF